MKILFLSAYFSPENVALTHLHDDLIEGLLKAGHQVEVLCPQPGRGVSKEVAQSYKGRKLEMMYGGKVPVRRFWAPMEKKNPVVRALRYFWCNFRHWQLGRRCRDVDLVFTFSTPPTQGLLAAAVCKKLKCGYIYGLQDVFPDSLVTTGLASEKSVFYKLGSCIEKVTYAKAAHIITLSDAAKENILRKGVPEEKITVVSNWIDTDAVKPVPKAENTLFEEFGIDREKFTVVYAGNMGAAQGAKVVLQAAELLPQVQFVIFGGGSGYEEAVEKAKQLPNVIINGLQPQSRVPEVYSLGDVALITCKKGVGTSGMPSKTWSIMACNTPIVAAFDPGSELDRIITGAQAGICVEPENARALAEAILACRKKGDAYGGGRAFVCENASSEVCVAEYLATMRLVARPE